MRQGFNIVPSRQGEEEVKDIRKTNIYKAVFRLIIIMSNTLTS